VSCPNCSAGEISPLTGRCELCGFAPDGHVAVQAPREGSVDALAHEELAALFRLDVVLGQGADSAVYVARERGSSRPIVVKVLLRPTEGRPAADDRFRHAVESVAALEHPHIVPVFGHGWTEHLYWYTMQQVSGPSLRSFLASRPPLDLKGCQRIVAQVAGALDYAHRRGVVHGALNPENVLVDAEGWIHVVDLLVRRAVVQPAFPIRPPGRPGGADEAAEGARRVERPPYVAPEVMEDGLLTAFSDQYALAVLVSECLVGAPPQERGDSGVAPATSLAVVRPDLPPHVAHAVRRALSPKPVDRFSGVLEFVAALEAYAPSLPDARPSGQMSGGVLVQTDWEPPEGPLKRRLVIGVAVVVVVAVLGLGLRLVATRLLGGPGDRAMPAYVEPPPDSAAAVAPPAASAPEAASLPPGREARRTPSGATRPGPAARAATEPARPRRQRAPSVAAGNASDPAAPQPADGGFAGRLFVNATPWGQLFVDGQLVGNTPKANLSVSPGSHAIRVVREGFEPFTRTIQVAAGQAVRLTDIVLVERRR
jgi:serine/threonine-protein kinase